MENNITGESIHCIACGSPIYISKIVSQAKCSTCGTMQSLDAFNSVKRHHSTVENTIQRAQSDRIGQSRYKQRQQSAQIVAFVRRNYWLLMVSGVLGISMWLTFMISHRDPIGERSGEQFILPGWNIIFAALWIYLAIRAYQNRVSTVSFHHSLEILCHNCGAPGTLTHGQKLDTCHYCQATLIPNASQMQQVQREADQVRKRAYFSLQRARRNHQILHNQHVTADADYSKTQVRIAVFTFIPISLAYVLSIPMVLIDRPVEPFVGYFAAISGLIGLLAGVPILLSVVREQRRRRKIASEIATSLPGRAGLGFATAKSWLDAYWNGPYSNRHLYMSDDHISAVGYTGYFPFLIDIEIWPPNRDLSTNRKTKAIAACRVIIAADIPGTDTMSMEQCSPLSEIGAQLPVNAQSKFQALQSQGWELEVSAGGIIGTCPSKQFRSLIRNPSHARELSFALERLAQAIAQCNAVPVEPNLQDELS